MQARITPEQAVPLFLPKLLLLARFLNRKIAAHSINPSGLFILARDQTFFKTLFFRGDRGSDFGMVKTEEILRFPQDDGLLFNHVWGKHGEPQALATEIWGKIYPPSDQEAIV